ncbi:LLM class flavin-dependent oxidoreductase [Nocardioides coralli]|uniref:LLM class flavin-dependent oxidoreductase n=1 Tax=Nocardioides coralli TaxID=2872154 RepID=UPI0024B4CBEF|nr:LLM class flavin-dependent oxidoreductase [Nocardioides coralli]
MGACGYRSSTSWRIRGWSPPWRSRPRPPGGTASFVWDHLRWERPVRDVADPWISLAAVATATEAIRFGPMVTPLARRRPLKVARETVTLDGLGSGRLVLGVGLGDDRFGREFASTGECTDPRGRARMLDESLDVLAAAWSGEPVHHHGEHYRIDGVEIRPLPHRREGIPVWVAGSAGRRKPLQRAARHQGYVPVNIEHPDQLAESVAAIDDLRGRPDEPYDVAVGLPVSSDPRRFASAGATWWLTELDPTSVTPDLVRGVIRDGPRSD